MPRKIAAGYQVSKLLSCQVNKLPSYQVTKLPSYQITKITSKQVTEVISYQVTKLPISNPLFPERLADGKRPFKKIACNGTHTHTLTDIVIQRLNRPIGPIQ